MTSIKVLENLKKAILEYNCEEAANLARKAGYSPKSARFIASRLHKNLLSERYLNEYTRELIKP